MNSAKSRHKIAEKITLLQVLPHIQFMIMANHTDTDSIPSYHTPKESQLAAVPKLQNHQPYQPSQ